MERENDHWHDPEAVTEPPSDNDGTSSPEIKRPSGPPPESPRYNRRAFLKDALLLMGGLAAASLPSESYRRVFEPPEAWTDKDHRRWLTQLEQQARQAPDPNQRLDVLNRLCLEYLAYPSYRKRIILLNTLATIGQKLPEQVREGLPAFEMGDQLLWGGENSIADQYRARLIAAYKVAGPAQIAKLVHLQFEFPSATRDIEETANSNGAILINQLSDNFEEAEKKKLLPDGFTRQFCQALLKDDRSLLPRLIKEHQRWVTYYQGRGGLTWNDTTALYHYAIEKLKKYQPNR